MLVPLLLAALSAAPVPLVCTEGAAVVGAGRASVAVTAVDSSLAALYASGVDFATFLASASARREQWVKHWEGSQVPADALADARALPGNWRILVSAVDGCSDSVNTIPYLARLVALVPTLEMRIVLPGPGRPIMEAHRTPDGRPATPTVVILDGAGNDVGCWVERPAALQAKAVEARSAGTLEDFSRNKQQWYDTDAGASTIREIVAVLKAAARASPRCDAPR